MIPYFEVSPFDVGGVTIYPFSLCILGGLFDMTVMGMRVAGLRRNQLVIAAMITALFVVGLPTGHVLFLAAHSPERLAHVNEWFDVLHGSRGLWVALPTFTVAALASWWVPPAQRPRTLDAAATGLISLWWWHRLGCTLVHDHPGTPSSFPLAIEGTCGEGIVGACHDLGFYGFLVAFTCFLLAIVVRSWLSGQGFVVMVPLLLYPPFWFATLGIDALPPTTTFRVVEGVVVCIGFAVGCWMLTRVPHALRNPLPPLERMDTP